MINKTFDFTYDPQADYLGLNSPVGTNGIQDIRRYANGYAKATITLLDYAAQSNDISIVDMLVYPILFCARHALELYLKDAILHLTKVRNINKIDLTEIEHIHDIDKIWRKFKNIATTTDRRYLSIIDKLSEYIDDFAQVDPTGQVFRYPKDNQNILHLQGVPFINLNKFGQRFGSLSEILTELNTLGRELVEEYSLGTYTKYLSRHDLEIIAKRLPPREVWGNCEFDIIKQSIIQEYQLSSRAFSDALNVIQKHRAFASEIGMELPLKYATTSTFITFLQIVDKLYPQSDLKSQGAVRFLDINLQDLMESNRRFGDCINSCKTLLSPYEIVDVLAIYELGKSLYGHCELYEVFIDEQLSMATTEPEAHLRLYLSKNNLKEFIKQGLKQLGQSKILLQISIYDSMP